MTATSASRKATVYRETPLRGFMGKSKIFKTSATRRRQTIGTVTRLPDTTTPAVRKDGKGRRLSFGSVADSLDPTSLIHQLKVYCQLAVKEKRTGNVPDAKNLNFDELENDFLKYNNLRKQMLSRRRWVNLENDVRIKVNLQSILQAAGKCIISVGHFTRSQIKEICTATDLPAEEAFIKQSYLVKDSQWINEMDKELLNECFEAIADLKSELEFKTSVLNNILTQIDAPQPFSRYRKSKAGAHNYPKEAYITPQTKAINPLSFTKIQQDCAERVAEEVLESEME
uniref:Uncharacterized protein n=1 Tax=Rhabditophanes sp. KR3021 TaxID=114890 RepID=A0AC35TTV9_9BILA